MDHLLNVIDLAFYLNHLMHNYPHMPLLYSIVGIAILILLEIHFKSKKTKQKQKRGIDCNLQSHSRTI